MILGNEVDLIDTILFRTIQKPPEDHACKPRPLLFEETVISTMAVVVYVSPADVGPIES